MTNVRIKLDTQTIQNLALFEKVTKASVKDCIEKDDEIIFIIDKKDFGKAIGRNGSNVKKMEQKLRKKVTLLKFDSNPEKFAENLLKPVPVKKASIENNDENQKILNIVIKSSQRAFPSKKVKKTKTLLKKYFPEIQEVIIRV
ncbi:NusA-like transcription termination signal-binding factor [archaeon CG07_land_8_20_14_0_80_38_8]|nr:MAG: NusA-like transcription termination signal-binding factor [archaeon CG07_land_8_20_14_0_80_38_8]PIU89148.1 MAG: NusA-like transcription termination signal-binding factor [archaeon CG06_land_8_20_14_3_00_37_11]